MISNLIEHNKQHSALDVRSYANGTLSDSRAISKWFDGGITGKTVVWSGDSTTVHLTTFAGTALKTNGSDGASQNYFPEMQGVSVYALGNNGMTLAAFLAGGGTAGTTLAEILAMDVDCYVYCWGINDCRTTDPAVYTAADLRSALVSLIDQTRAAKPSASIIMRMPNSHETGAALITGAATAQNCMDRYQEAYRGLETLYDNLIVWDSHNSLFGNVANTAAGSDSKLLDADGFHPSNSGYTQTIIAVTRLLVPVRTQYDDNVSNAACYSIPLTQDLTTGHLQWNTNIDPKVLEGPEWYKVYRVQFGQQTDGSLYDLYTINHFGAGDNTAATAAVTGVAPGLVKGDIISFRNINAPNGTFVINKDIPATAPAGGRIRFLYSSAADPEHPSKIDAVNDNTALLPDGTYGYVYRHKYAFCESMRYLQGLMDTDGQTAYEANTPIANPYAVASRFAIFAATDGSITLQTISSEGTGDLTALGWSVNDYLCIPGVSGGGTVTTISDMALPLTGATIDVVTDAANQRVIITLAGTDFTNAVIPQGYRLSAT